MYTYIKILIMYVRLYMFCSIFPICIQLHLEYFIHIHIVIIEDYSYSESDNESLNLKFKKLAYLRLE